MANIGDPLILTAQATISPTADATPNLASLTNPYGLPMELLEVRFSIYSKTTTDGSYNQVTGQGVGVKMDLGKVAVVDNGVPVSAFGSYRNATNPGTGSRIVLPGATNTTNVETYTWRLKYPLYIKGGATLNVKFTNKSQVPADVVATVTYHCRVMEKGYRPKRVMVPWVCAYNAPAVDVVASNSATTATSTELEVANPFGVPLEMARLVGLYSEVTAGSAGQINYASEGISLMMPWQFTYVNMRSSQGDDIVFTDTPFEGLFPTAWRAWDLPDGTTMEPGEWLKTTITNTAIDYTPTAALTGRAFFSVALVGYRQVGASEFDIASGALVEEG